MATFSGSTPRILTRGETTQFKVSFFADDGLTVPLVPVTPDYPRYTIYQPDGTAVQTGVGTLTSAGVYTAPFMPAKDAPLSYFNKKPQTYNDQAQGMELTADGARYRIEWQIVTAENIQANFVEEFDVRDTAITQSQNRELKYMTLAGDSFRVMYPTTNVPTVTRLRILVRGNDAVPVFEEQLDLTNPNQPIGNIKYAKDGDRYVMYYDLPLGLTQRNTCYIALWGIQETPFTPATTEYQMITSVSTNILPMIVSLRMLIDRFQKRLGRVRAFEDSDLLEYINRGSQLVNQSYPTTGYSLNNMPDGLMSYVLLAAGWWGLKAQSILDADMNFNFSGQAVTLSLDSQGAIDSAASSMMELFNSGTLAAAKMTYVRAARGVGTVAVRGYGPRSLNDTVFKISGGQSLNSDYFGLLTKIGLL